VAVNNIAIQIIVQAQQAQQQVNSFNQALGQMGPAAARASSQATAGISSVTVALNETTRAFGQFTSALAGLALFELGKKMMEAGDAISRVGIGFKAMTGSGAMAVQVMSELRDIAKETPFAFTDIAEGARRLQAFGFATREIPGDIEAIAKAVKTIGGGTEEIDSITHALGIMREKGVAQAQQLFRTLAAQGIDVMSFIRKRIEEDYGQILDDKQIRNLIQKGRLGGEQTAEAILEGIKKIPDSSKEMMDLTSSHLQKLRDEFGFLSKKINEDTRPTVNKGLDSITRGMQSLEEHAGARKTVEWASVIVTAIGGILTTWRLFEALKISQRITTVTDALGPMAEAIGGVSGAIMILVGAITAAATAWGLWEMIGPTGQKHIEDSFGAAARNIKKAYGDIFDTLEKAGKAGLKHYLPESGVQTLRGLRPVPGVPMPSGALLPQAPTNADLERDKANREARKKILEEDEALARSQAEAAESILARAQEQATRGLPAIEIRFAHTIKTMQDAAKEALTQVAPDTLANLAKAKTIEIDTFITEQERKSREARLQEEKRYWEDQLELAKYATRVESEMALAVVQDTSDKQAQAQINQLAIIQRGADEERRIRLEIADRNYKIAKEKTDILIQDQLRTATGNMAQIWHIHQLELDLRARDDADYTRERAKADIDSARIVAEARAEITKQAAQQTSEYLKSIREDERQAAVASAERQIAIGRLIYENGEAQTARQKIAGIEAAAQYDIAAVDRVAKIKADNAYEVALDEYNSKIRLEKSFNKDALALSEQGKDEEARYAWDMAQQQYELAVAIQRKFYTNDVIAAQEATDQKTMLALRAQKEMNDAWLAEQRQIFEKFESGVGHVFDALFERGKSFWKRISDMAFDASKQALKALVVPVVSAQLMSAMGMPVTLESRGDFGSGAFAQVAALFTKHPVFQNLPKSKLEQAGHLGDATVTPDGKVRVQIDAVNLPRGGPMMPPRMPFVAPPSGGGGGGFTLPFIPPMPMIPPPEAVQAGAVGTVFRAEGGGEPVYTYSTYPGYTSTGGYIGGGGGGGGGGSWGSGGYGGAGLGGILSSVGGATGGASGAQLGTLASLANMPLLPQNAPQMMQMMGTLKSLKGLGGGLSGLGSGLAGLIGPAAVVGGIAGIKGGFDLARWAQRQTGSRKALGAAGAIGLGAFSGVIGMLGLAAMFPELLVPFLAAGPIGWIAAAGVGAAIAIIGLLKKSDTAHARDLVKQMYGIDIRNQQVLAEIVQIAKQKYGGAISIAVASPEVQQLVNLYAATQGMGVVGPRPMYPATLAQSAGGLQLQPTYSNGQLVSSPYAGTTTQQWATAGMLQNALSQNLLVQLDPHAASQLFAGQVVNVINGNPTVVGNANTSSITTGNNRTAQLGGLLEPATVHA
jgi:hypothetical protein